MIAGSSSYLEESLGLHANDRLDPGSPDRLTCSVLPSIVLEQAVVPAKHPPDLFGPEPALVKAADDGIDLSGFDADLFSDRLVVQVCKPRDHLKGYLIWWVRMANCPRFSSI